MSERGAPRAGHAALPGAALAALLALAGLAASPAAACVPVAEDVALCTEGTVWAALRAETFDDVVTWVGDGYWVEFNPLLSQVAAAGPAAATLDGLVAALLAEDGAPAAGAILRDRFDTATGTVERVVMRVDEDGTEYLAGLMLSDFDDGTPRLAWSISHADTGALDEMRGMIEATAAGLRPRGGN